MDHPVYGRKVPSGNRPIITVYLLSFTFFLRGHGTIIRGNSLTEPSLVPVYIYSNTHNLFVRKDGPCMVMYSVLVCLWNTIKWEFETVTIIVVVDHRGIVIVEGKFCSNLKDSKLIHISTRIQKYSVEGKVEGFYFYPWVNKILARDFVFGSPYYIKPPPENDYKQ